MANENGTWIMYGVSWDDMDVYPVADAGAIRKVIGLKAGERKEPEKKRAKVERAAITKASWRQEGIAFYSCREGSRVPVYRLYNPNSGEHFFTNTNAEKNMLIKTGWKYEGIGFYALCNK